MDSVGIDTAIGLFGPIPGRDVSRADRAKLDVALLVGTMPARCATAWGIGLFSLDKAA